LGFTNKSQCELILFFIDNQIFGNEDGKFGNETPIKVIESFQINLAYVSA
jgi:hypothetical protein